MDRIIGAAFTFAAACVQAAMGELREHTRRARTLCSDLLTKVNADPSSVANDDAVRRYIDEHVEFACLVHACLAARTSSSEESACLSARRRPVSTCSC